MSQVKQSEWHEQWSKHNANETFLFEDWIKPYKLDYFKGKTVLECGCGKGQHTAMMAKYASQVTAVDLNTSDLAKENNKQLSNVTFIEDDIATMKLNSTFDVVLSVGVVHHTDNPDKTIENMKRYLKPGGHLIVWVYSKEGNAMVEYIVEPLRKWFLTKLSRDTVWIISKLITFLMCLPVFTLYCLPLRFLPYYEYFTNFRQLSFYRNTLNVFDKLNAPHTDLISKQRAEKWTQGMNDISIIPYKGVSWSIVATKPADDEA